MNENLLLALSIDIDYQLSILLLQRPAITQLTKQPFNVNMTTDDVTDILRSCYDFYCNDNNFRHQNECAGQKYK